jgi:hypothetical protein
MAANYLEQLLAEWYQFSGYFVRQNVLVGRRPNGGYECELDVVAFHPKTKHVVHVEPSMDCHKWSKREARFRKKFAAGRKYIPTIFEGLDVPPQIEQIAVLVYASKVKHQTIGGASICLIEELLAEIIASIRKRNLNTAAIPEHFTILRTLQFVAKYPQHLQVPLFGSPVSDPSAHPDN